MLEELLNSLSNCWQAQVILGATVVGVSIVIYMKQCAASKAARLRAEWDGRGKDIVTLHMFNRAMTAPNSSPYPIKLELYLKIMDIEYVPDFKVCKSTKGKSPWITVNGVDVADSQLAIEYLTKALEKDLEKGLTDEEKAISRSFRIMLEDHYYWCVVLERWLYDDAKDVLTFFPPTLFPNWLPKTVVNFLLKRYGKSVILPQTHGQGMGRHNQQEVEEFGRADLTAISDYLGKKPYLLGDHICLADLTLFSFVCMVKILPEYSASVFKCHIEQNCQNLLEHHGRIVEKYWPDYERCRFGVEDKVAKKG